LNFKELVIKNRSIADLLLRSIKHILLFISFYFVISSSELFCKIFDPLIKEESVETIIKSPKWKIISKNGNKTINALLKF
jgi:hypothetical protein